MQQPGTSFGTADAGTDGTGTVGARRLMFDVWLLSHTHKKDRALARHG